MIRKALIATELAAMYALYHQPRPDDATFELLATDWTELLDDLTESEFVQGMKQAKRVCRFLPVPADVLKCVEENRRKGHERGQAALPEACPSAEDFERNRQNARNLLDRLRRKTCADGPVRAEFSAATNEVRQ